ncbi:hypothetical protein [Dyadobacter sp. BHUBP1]|uniref:hypothetical protein n=1 Tax=Dyadobacter sp. BHUBP1 TaxID=3424178 RepID=UPI003D32D604
MDLSLSADIFEKFNKEAGFSSPDESDLFKTEAAIDPKVTDHIKSVLASTAPKGVDTKPPGGAPPSQAEALPDYFKPFEDVLSKKFEFAEPDSTDYSSLAVKEFGPNFAHLNSRDAVYDHSFYTLASENFLQENPQYQEALAVADGQFDEGDFLRDVIASQMRKNPFNFTKANYQEKLEEYFEEGKINDEGKRLVAEIKKEYKSIQAGLEQQARSYAASELAKYKEYRTTFADELKNFSLYGIELSDDIKRHIQEYVTSGKAKEAQTAATSMKDFARREILNALVSSEKAFLEVMRLVDKRGIDYGYNKKARTLLN